MFSKFLRLSAAFVLASFAGSASAQNACGPVELLTDEAGDWDGTIGAISGVSAGLPEQDLVGLTVSQNDASGETLLTFKLLLADAPLVAPLPNAAWYSSFETPDGVIYGVRMQTDETGAERFFSYLASPSNGGQIDGRFIAAGSEKPAEAGSEFGGDGITIIVKAGNIGLSEPGQTLGPFNAATIQSVPEGVLAATVDEAPAGLGRDGFFDTQVACSGKSGSGLTLGGGLGLGLLLPLALLALRRRLYTNAPGGR